MRQTILLFIIGQACLCQAQNEPNLRKPFDGQVTYHRNAWLAGIQIGYSNNFYMRERYTAIQAYGGYFITNKLIAGLAVSRGQESFGTAQDVAISAGPMVRYQFTRTRFSPCIVGAYQFGQATVSGLRTRTPTPGVSTDKYDRPIQSRYVGVGMSIRIVAAYRLDLLLTWQDKPGAAELGLKGNYNLLQAQAGVNYLINRKR